MKTKKDRRHSGRVTPKIVKPKMKWDEIKEQALEPNENWDDWVDYRDGFRDIESKKRKEMEKKKRK